MIIDCISDLHGDYPTLSGGDLLIIAGDLTATDSEKQHYEFFHWMQQTSYKKVVWIAGNHDMWTQKNVNLWIVKAPEQGINIEYLRDSGTEFEYEEDYPCNFCNTPRPGSPWIKCSHSLICPGKYTKTLKIWGSPWTRSFEGMNPHCTAFTEPTEEQLMAHFQKIPLDTDILITHSPRYGVLDDVPSYVQKIRPLGSTALKSRMEGMTPKLHVFGHLHEQGGKKIDYTNPDGSITICVNAAHMDRVYHPRNKPVRVIL